MREIKFRAINAEGNYIYGLPYTDGVNETLYYKDFNNRLCWRDEDGAHCNQPYKNGTLEQYTGMNDKNGKEIYEGDVWKRDIYVGIVVFEYCGWNFKKAKTSGCYQYPSFYSNAVTGEVIGTKTRSY